MVKFRDFCRVICGALFCVSVFLATSSVFAARTYSGGSVYQCTGQSGFPMVFAGCKAGYKYSNASVTSGAGITPENVGTCIQCSSGENCPGGFAQPSTPCYKLTLNKDGGTGGGDLYYNSTEIYKNNTCTTAFSWPIATPTKTGYTFAGYYYNTSSQIIDGSGNLTSGGGYFVYALKSGSLSNPALTAQWTPNTYTVTYKAGQGGVGNAVTQSVTYMQDFTAKPADTFSKPNATFNKWSANVGGTLDANKTIPYPYPGNMELTATWNCNTGYTLNSTTGNCDANTITISWYGVKTVPSNSGFSTISNSVATSTVPYAGNIVTPTAAVVGSAGQTFLGWKFGN